MIISLLVAADENSVIGLNNQLPWNLPADLKYFKNLTWAMPVVMGRKTFDAITKPLPGRKNVVITRNQDWKSEGVTIAHSVDDAVKEAASEGAKEIFIIGGAEIFNQSWPVANRIYLTRIHHTFKGDAFFPEFDLTMWKKVKSTFCSRDEVNLYDYTFEVWERK